MVLIPTQPYKAKEPERDRFRVLHLDMSQCSCISECFPLTSPAPFGLLTPQMFQMHVHQFRQTDVLL